ncbi:MAG: toll/interleukin-1 receptor domain-containing protein [Ruminococcaceae bacterium]|nr:toll/interleukin-1 receptor domain-containing protein [Oscillospiraceae bacterium]
MNKKNIFISYGHGIYDEAVKRLAQDLRGFGFSVFVDVDYLKLGDWEKIIDEHILASKYFLFMVSARSVSHEGYCLNELCRAGENNAEIIPVKLDDSILPLSINKHQRLSLIPSIAPDGTLVESVYKNFLLELVEILSGKTTLGFSDSELRLRSALKPVSSKDFTYRYYSNFCGRRDVFAEVEKFLEGHKNVFWLSARPGTGKTAFSSMLTWRYPENVGAAHFCKFNNSDRVNPKVIISSVAYQLSEILPEYKERLLGLMELDTLFEKSAARIFEYIITEPLAQIECDRPVMVIIDALDECSWRGSNEICNILRTNCDNFPSWLKFFLTSRNEPVIRRTLLPIAHTYTLSEEKTEDDLREFYRSRFPDAPDDKIELLLTKSEGSFLYATEIVKQIKDQNLGLDDINFFPIGIYGFFNDCFSRIFDKPNEDALDYDSVKPLLEFLCIVQEPTDVDFLEDFLEWDEYRLKNTLARINGLFPIKDNHIEPLHKSLIDWLTTDDVGQVFYISRKNGYKRLLGYIENVYSAGKWHNNKFVLRYFGSVLIELGRYDRLAEILDDHALITRIIDYFEFDSGLEYYLEKLEALYANDKNGCIALLSGETFIKIFSENRRLLYNSGMFFRLKAVGLSTALQKDTRDWGLEGETGKVFYYYIVEDFAKAIKKANMLISKTEELSLTSSLLSELYNVKGLSERKLVEFDDALESFEKTIEYAELALDEADSANSDAEFEISLAHLIKGKIFLSTLRFDESNKSCRRAVKVLSRRIEDMPDGDKKTSNRLFLAEDYRVFAYGYIWQGEYEAAEEKLLLAEEIYRDNGNMVDRYYVRFKYTSLFLRIMKGESVLEELKNLITEVASSKYDKGQVHFLTALDIFLCHKDDEALMQEGLRQAKSGSDIYDMIDSYLEKAECDLLVKYFSDALAKRAVIDSEDNEYIDAWVDYIDGVLRAK